MSFVALSVICLVGLAGPLLAYPRGLHLPIVFGELVVGIVLGKTGFDYFDSANSTYAFLANVGFALVMFVAGSHVPLRNPAMRPALSIGLKRVAAVTVGAVAVGLLIARLFNNSHGALYAVLLA